MRGRVLIVAGSDSGGGAGIQADIKTVTMLDAYAATAVTALTAQNTKGVFGVLPIPPEFVRLQIEVVLDEAGAPRLEYLDGVGSPRRLPHAVSLSHTSDAAVAVVVRVDVPQAPVPLPTVVVATPSPPTVPALPPRPRGSALLVVLNLLAIGLASLALARTFPNFRWFFPG